MTVEERQREFELRQMARERNRLHGAKEWVVYRGQLARVSEMRVTPSGNLQFRTASQP